MRARILSILMTVLMLVALVPMSAMAATFEEINQQEVFLTQENNGTCYEPDKTQDRDTGRE